MTTKNLARIAILAAVYAAVSLALAPISFSNIQIRLSEALTLLPLVWQPSIWGLTLGCFLANLIGAMTGVNPTGLIDAVVGTSATLLAAICTYRFRNRLIHGIPVLSILMPVIFNAVIVGIELGFLFFPGNVLTGSLICGLEVGAGELTAVILGWFLMKALKRTRIFEEN